MALATHRRAYDSAHRAIPQSFFAFELFDNHFANPKSISVPAFARLCPERAVHKYRLVFGWLHAEGILNLQSPDAKRAFELIKEASIVERFKTEPFHRLLHRYYQNILEENALSLERRGVERLKHRSIKSCIETLGWFFRYLGSQGLSNEREISQDHLDDYINSRATSIVPQLARPIRWMNKHADLFRRLVLPKPVKTSFRRELFLGDEKLNSILSEMLACDASKSCDASERRNALIVLLIVLYGQKIRNIVKLRLDDLLRLPSDQYQLRFGRTEVALAPEVSNVLYGYLNVRKGFMCLETNSPWLFPGGVANMPIRTTAIHPWLSDRLGVSEAQLLSSSIDRMLRLSDVNPKVITETTGISRVTVTRYWERTNPRVREEVAYARSKGRF